MKKTNEIVQRIKSCYVAKKMIELIRNNDSILGKFKLSENCDYNREEYSALAYDKFEKEQGLVLKKTRK